MGLVGVWFARLLRQTQLDSACRMRERKLPTTFYAVPPRESISMPKLCLDTEENTEVSIREQSVRSMSIGMWPGSLDDLRKRCSEGTECSMFRNFQKHFFARF